MPLFDRAVPTYLLRDRRQTNGEVMVGRREKFADLSQKIFVVGNQSPLGPALRAVAEGVKCGAAQEFEFHEHSENRQYPWSERDFSRFTGCRIAPRQQRRCQMEFEAQLVAVETRLYAIEE